ncbi:MAG: hypothetical protein NC037_06535, partial [Bacteroides sp.]|nr:hypothetical protein [Bacteroides sp.]
SAHKQEYSTCYLNCDYSADSSNAYSLYSDNAQTYKLTVGISLLNDDDSDKADVYVGCQIMFFKSEQDAKDTYNGIKDDYADVGVITQKGKLIIIESEAGAYDTILKARVAENSAESEQLKFYKTALKNELNAKNATVEASYSTTFGGAFYLATSPVKGNIVNRYIYGPTNFFGAVNASNAFEENFLDNYSADSYIKKSGDNFYLYAAPKIGFHFAKDSEKDEYAVTGYYYEDASDTLTIPSTYNDLPVVGIANLEIPNETEAITIPSSITNLAGLVSEIQNAENLATINYEGTKAQWQELGISNSDLANIDINCSDDDNNDDNNNNDDDDDNDDFDGTISISLDFIDAAITSKFSEYLNEMLGYALAHGGEYDYLFVNFSFASEAMRNDYSELVGNFPIFITGIDNSSIECSLWIFETAQDADAYIAENEADMSGNIIKDGNIVLVESEAGFYNKVKNSANPTNLDANTQSALKFFNNSLKKEISESSYMVSCEILFDPDYLAGISIYGTQIGSNVSKLYSYNSAKYIEENKYREEYYNSIDFSQYSDDSYVEKQSDGSYISYLKNKLGFTFEETDDKTGYKVTGYYYADGAPETLVIPSTYNSKPVIELGENFDFYINTASNETTAMTIPQSVTCIYLYAFSDVENLKTINYQGTKAQWKAINIYHNYLANIEVIHCTDGDLDKNENEI